MGVIAPVPARANATGLLAGVAAICPTTAQFPVTGLFGRWSYNAVSRRFTHTVLSVTIRTLGSRLGLEFAASADQYVSPETIQK